jgi:hypothetical protein
VSVFDSFGNIGRRLDNPLLPQQGGGGAAAGSPRPRPADVAPGAHGRWGAPGPDWGGAARGGPGNFNPDMRIDLSHVVPARPVTPGDENWVEGVRPKTPPPPTPPPSGRGGGVGGTEPGGSRPGGGIGGARGPDAPRLVPMESTKSVMQQQHLETLVAQQQRAARRAPQVQPATAQVVQQAAHAAHLQELSEARGYLLELACVHAFNESYEATLRGLLR